MRIKNTENIFLCLFLIYSGFVLYGSIVPLQYHHLSLQDAVAFFINLDVFPSKGWSRIDLATNILLGMPVSFLAMSAFFDRTRQFQRFLFPFLILFYCLLLASTAEFLQIFFSSRTPSLGDVFAQAIGACLGLFIWFLVGPYLARSVSEFITTRLFDKKINFFFSAYLLILLVYNIMPLDLTLNPIDVYHKWSQGRINLIPFAFKSESASILFYNIVVDIMKWGPISFFLVYFKSVQVSTAILATLGIAFSIEIAQLFVFSRITDTTDLVTALIGGSLGAILPTAAKRGMKVDSDFKKKQPGILGIPMMVLACWMVAVILINWFPFDFTFDKNMIKHKLNRLSLIPFSYYQLNDVYYAMTSALRKIALFMPGGFILSFVIKNGRVYSKTVNIVIIFVFSVLIAGCAGLIEIGQFFLPRKVPDLTDIILEMSGAGIGFWSLHQIYKLRQKS